MAQALRDPAAMRTQELAAGADGLLCGRWGALIQTGSRWSVFAGYVLGASLMLGAAFVAVRWAVAVEGKPLENVARPLAYAD